MRCGDSRRAVGQQPHITAMNETVAAGNHLLLRVPYYQLTAWRVHEIVIVDIATFARTAAGCTERNLAQSSDFPHHIGRLVGPDYIDFVVTFIGMAQKPRRC